MNSAIIEEHLKNIQLKLHQLVKQYHVLQKENEQLKKQLSKEQNNTLVPNKNFDATETFAKNLSASQKADLENKINGYLKEINKCLTLLNH